MHGIADALRERRDAKRIGSWGESDAYPQRRDICPDRSCSVGRPPHVSNGARGLGGPLGRSFARLIARAWDAGLCVVWATWRRSRTERGFVAPVREGNVQEALRPKETGRLAQAKERVGT
jgi:hypothetical protein